MIFSKIKKSKNITRNIQAIIFFKAHFCYPKIIFTNKFYKNKLYLWSRFESFESFCQIFIQFQNSSNIPTSTKRKKKIFKYKNKIKIPIAIIWCRPYSR